MKRYCVLLVGGALLAAVTVSVGQPPSPVLPPTPLVPAPVQPPSPVLPLTPLVPAPVQPQVTPAKEESIEELMARLDSIKAEQEKLEKARKETVARVKEKLKQQKERLQKLGVSVEEGPVPPPPVSATVGQVGDVLIGVGADANPAPKAESPGRDSERR